MINIRKLIAKLLGSINIPPTNAPPEPVSEGQTSDPGELVTKIALEQKMEIVHERLRTHDTLIIGVIFVLAICFVTLFYGYWQFASTNFSDYRNAVNNLNDSRYQTQQSEIDVLLRIATSSGSFGK